VKGLWDCRSGATAIEYGLIIAIIGMMLAGAATAIGTAASAKLDSVNTAVAGA
jgi:Flp pilus assembly pilin Flp